MYGGMSYKLSMLRQKTASGGGDVTPELVNMQQFVTGWEDDCDTSIFYESSQVPITGINVPISFRVVITDPAYTADPPYYFGYKKSATTWTPITYASLEPPYIENIDGWTLIENSGVIDNINNGDYLSFMANSIGSDNSVEITIYNISDNNANFGTFLLEYWGSVCGCFLTTSVVHRMALRDDGPELTAMRTLRNHYYDKDIQYKQIIDEYYNTSPKIIQEINKLPNSDDVYTEIYNVVKICQSLVENNEFELAHDAYLNMYYHLKNRYLIE